MDENELSQSVQPKRSISLRLIPLDESSPQTKTGDRGSLSSEDLKVPESESLASKTILPFPLTLSPLPLSENVSSARRYRLGVSAEKYQSLPMTYSSSENSSPSPESSSSETAPPPSPTSISPPLESDSSSSPSLSSSTVSESDSPSPSPTSVSSSSEHSPSPPLEGESSSSEHSPSPPLESSPSPPLESSPQESSSSVPERISFSMPITITPLEEAITIDTSLPTLHIIGLFHTVTSLRWSHCAFTGKVLRFSKMMRKYGYRVVEYSNGVSESQASEKVQIFTEEELMALLARTPGGHFHGDQAKTGSPAHTGFSVRLTREMMKRVKKGDIVCHPFGTPHQHLVAELDSKGPIHVESGIGYPHVWCAQKIFETNAWMHWHYGKAGQEFGSNYQFVAPNYFDLDEWKVSDNIIEAPHPLVDVFKIHKERLVNKDLPIPLKLRDRNNPPYVAFLGRIYEGKGVNVILDLANAMPDELFVLCGQGDPKPYLEKSVHYNIIAVEPITGLDRSFYFGAAKCAIMPTRFIEPFGGSGVEAMLCGTPVLTSSFGAFTETVIHGVTGYRCTTMGDWKAAVEKAETLDRSTVAHLTRERFSLEAVGKTYDGIFKTLHDLKDKGYYTQTSHFI